ADQDEQLGYREIACRELHFAGPDLLAEILRCAADHQPGDEYRDDRHDQHAVQARAHPAWCDLPDLHVEQLNQPAQAAVRVVCRIDGPGGGQSGHIGEDRGVENTEALLDSLHGRTDRGGHGAVVGQLETRDQSHADRGEHTHDCRDRVTLPLAVDHAAEGARQGKADDGQQEDLHPVGPGRRVLEGVGGVGVVEATSVGAEFLDGFLAGDRPAGDGLLDAVECGHDLVVQMEVLDDAAGDQYDRPDKRQRQQDAHGAADQVHPEVPYFN